MDIKVKDIIKICNAELIYGSEEEICGDFVKDTKEIKQGDVYIGIKGEKFDGSTFFETALENGAKICLLENVEIPQNIQEKYKDRTIIKVDNTIKAIQKLATYKRSMYNIPVVAVTGSVGKTSTKDILASVVQKKYKVLKTQGNLNNHIGLPLTILKLKDEEALVVEMGMSAIRRNIYINKHCKTRYSSNYECWNITYRRTWRKRKYIKGKTRNIGGAKS